MITLENLTYYYRKGIPAIDVVNANIGSGMYLLLGENGAGKTTLWKLISGLLYPRSGECRINNQNVASRQPLTLRDIFYLGDNMVFPADTINTMAAIHAPFYPTFNARQLAANLEMFGMNGYEKLNSLSLGNRHKAQVAYALALGTQVLLMDEPTNGLDITSKQILAKMIAQCVSEEQTVIVSTHNVDNFPNLYDGVIVLSHGRMLLNAPIWQITERISFNASMEVPATDTLYSEQRFGLYRTITPNTTGDETTLDYTLLYNSLMSSNRDKIIKQITHTDSSQL
ncbi:MAG: ABC transporter ATP-binding protein [Muribaculaceae bacterium]|nr:ABC transporter ATP-binding protein [Muribaculaceae bacterium]